jgi:transposase-like protein
MCESIPANIIDDRPNQRHIDEFFRSFEDDSACNNIDLSGKRETDQSALWQLPLKIRTDNVIVLQDPHCPICAARLIKNGRNRKVTYEHEEQSPSIYWLQRYLCLRCGEIRLDYSTYFIESKYGKEIPKMCRLLYFLGLPPPMIQRILITILTKLIPLSTIKSWIYPLKTDLVSVVYPKHMPCSGSVVYDEIHLRLDGKKAYLFVAIDPVLHLVIRSEIRTNLERSDVKTFFQHIHQDENVVIESVVHDGAVATGSAFGDRSLKKIKEGLCHTHFKWNIREKVYDAAGLGKQVKKQLPGGAFRFYRMCKWLIDAKDEFRFIIRTEAVRSFADTLKNEKYHKIVNTIVANQELLQQHVYSPDLAKTTALVESINHEIEAYRVFKHGEQTLLGGNFTAATRTYIHNLKAIYRLPKKLAKEHQYLDFLHEQYGFCEEVRSKKCSFGHFQTRIEAYQKGLEEYWASNFPIRTLDLFKKIWRVDH